MHYLLLFGIYASGYLLAFYMTRKFIRKWNDGVYGKREMRDTTFLSIFSWMIPIIYLYFTFMIWWDDNQDEKAINKQFQVEEGTDFGEEFLKSYFSDNDIQIDKKQ